MTVRQLVGDCRVTLPTLAAGSVQSAITSPPYFSLRDYGTPPLVWGGDAEHQHLFGPQFHTISSPKHNGLTAAAERFDGNPRNASSRERAEVAFTTSTGSFCACGAWLGSLGLEPTVELYVEHIVECFRHVKRVLRDDGIVWCNLGDSYAGSGKGPTGHNGLGDQTERQGFKNASFNQRWNPNWAAGGKQEHQRPARSEVPGYKPKDLMMIPSRVAMALQADGWWLRSVIPWLKRNSMPESVTDRPATSIEYVFLLSKSARYFYDAEAVRADSQPWSTKRPDGWDSGAGAHSTIHRNGREAGASTGEIRNGRNRRNADWFFESWQGLMLDEADDPLVLVVNPTGFKQAHFATFPPKLVEPMVKASTSEKGQCPECGAPWVRQTEPTFEYQAKLERGRQSAAWKAARRNDAINVGVAFGDKPESGSAEYITVGWHPSCAHTTEPVPQTILDPFAGAMTTLLVADRLGRNAVGCELKPEYADMGTGRVRNDAPLFTDVVAD